MARLPVLSGAEAVRILHKAGWTVDRSSASEIGRALSAQPG
jgi:predicted RNA binding protein YcfA (HicA-like mRNA interferase family)